LSTLLKEIQEDYELCLLTPSEYQIKVDSISNMFGLRGKNRLKSDNCPVYVVGRYQTAPVVTFGVNPGYSTINNPREEIEARKSWEHYQSLYLNFFRFFSFPYYLFAFYYGIKPVKIMQYFCTLSQQGLLLQILFW
jgi:hypothetical protein